MFRFHRFYSFILLAASPLLAESVVAQQDFSTVQIIPHHVADSVYYSEASGGNIGLSTGEDGVLMIDDQSVCF